MDTNNLSREQLLAIVTQQQEAIAALKTASQRKLTCKVSEKGAVSVYGLGRFPVTLYASQWGRLLGEAEHIKRFISQNEASLAKQD